MVLLIFAVHVIQYLYKVVTLLLQTDYVVPHIRPSFLFVMLITLGYLITLYRKLACTPHRQVLTYQVNAQDFLCINDQYNHIRQAYVELLCVVVYMVLSKLLYIDRLYYF